MQCARFAPLMLLWLVCVMGCTPDPVQETVEIDLVSDAEARITATVAITPVGASSHPVAASMVDRVSRDLLDETDEWSRRFAAIRPIEEQRQWTRRHGDLIRVEHSAIVDPGSIGLFFGDVPLSVFLTGGEGWRELAIYPGAGSRASIAEQKILDQRLDGWLKSVSRYYGIVAEIYDYTNRNPERAPALLTAMFGGETVVTEPERVLLDRFDEELDEIVGILGVDEDDAISVQRVSYLVYVPFPAALRIRVEGDVLLYEGMEPESDGTTFEIPRIGLWEAFVALEGRWISPDPLTSFLSIDSEETDEGAQASLEDFLEIPRVVHGVPSARELKEALLAELRPESVYRVRWRPGPPAPAE